MMKKRYFMGIDVAKTSFDFSVLSTGGALLWRGHLDNEPQAIEGFLAQLRRRGGKFSYFHVGLESSGVYGNKLLSALHQAGLTVSVLNPAQVKFFAMSVLRRTKNDRVDAGIIARFCLERRPMSTQPVRRVEQQLKLLVHERESRVAEQTRELNRAKKDPFEVHLPLLICHQRQQRLQQLHHEISQLDKAINELVANDEHLKTQSKLLCSIPGIAQTTAAKLLGELAGKEFHSARQLAAYAGLTPSEFRSGASAYGKTHLSKIGNAFLRKALYLPAAVAKKWCRPLKPWITLLQQRKLAKLAIRGAIMRKLLHIAFGILKHQKPFDPALVFVPKTV